ncbi:hypothetical protein LOD99_2529 [Oopsacas minuta]|uniref:Uncharacterized protein n=1 Tax=Oopsacas minuta TaxID=111878 RepID=A0AAV7K4N6_9METZ|nr:hypothetical protein LOD99_2529 [Oopsacas minuta]
MSAISPLSSPEYVTLPSVDRPKARRLTQDLQQAVNVTYDSNPLTLQYSSWSSFFDKYSGDLVGIDQEELHYPFDPLGELLPLPSSIPRVSPSSESYNSSSQDSYNQREDTPTIQNDLMTPLRGGEEVRRELGDTLELGNCTYELDLNNLTSTLSKLNTTRSAFADSSIHKQSTFDVSSSTPLHNGRINITSDLVTYDVSTPAISVKRSIRTRMNFDNELFKSPIPSKSQLMVKPADSTEDLEGEDVFVRAGESFVTGTHPPCEIRANKDSTVIIQLPKPPAIPGPRTQSTRSALPVTTRVSRLTCTSSSRLMRGMRAASSTSSLPQLSGRASLLPTSHKSKSHERINTPATVRGFAFKK